MSRFPLEYLGLVSSLRFGRSISVLESHGQCAYVRALDRTLEPRGSSTTHSGFEAYRSACDWTRESHSHLGRFQSDSDDRECPGEPRPVRIVRSIHHPRPAPSLPLWFHREAYRFSWKPARPLVVGQITEQRGLRKRAPRTPTTTPTPQERDCHSFSFWGLFTLASALVPRFKGAESARRRGTLGSSLAEVEGVSRASHWTRPRTRAAAATPRLKRPKMERTRAATRDRLPRTRVRFERCVCVSATRGRVAAAST